ncbi:MAG: hypothetical protein HY457_02360 [Parcubacteria group bacterium]|nr:hypothetical protein [Parcubacteria group bacterium]
MRTEVFKTIFFFTLAFAVVGGFFLIGDIDVIRAQSGSVPLNGWAWSSNVGWISFNCAATGTCASVNYGVTVDSGNGQFSGYAWSPSIGWISFRGSDTTGCPQSPCQATLTSGAVSGWAKALAGTVSNDDWDGWIHLAGSGYGPTLSGSNFSGYSWGDDVIGWMKWSTSFGGVTLASNPPTVTLSGDPLSVPTGDTSTLTWSSTDANTCTGTAGSADWLGSKSTSGSEVVGPVNQTTTYTIQCSGLAGTASDSEVINVLPPDFSLTRTNDPIINFVGSGGDTSNPTRIRVTPLYGFSADVALSASPSSLQGQNVTYTFGDSTLSSNEYNAGSSLTITIPNPISEGIYTVTVRGESAGGLVRTIAIPLEVNVFTPGFEEI